MTDRAAIIELTAKAADDCGLRGAYIAQQIRALAAVTPAPLSIPEREKVRKWPLGCLKPNTCARHKACAYMPCPYRDLDAADVREQIESALAALEGK